MGLSTGSSILGARGFATTAMSLSVGTSFLGGGGLRTSALAPLTPTQALVASFQGTGLLDALLVFDPAHYTTPGSTPGVLVDALGGPITYTAPNTQATPTAVQDASGYTYASADGIDDTLIASANQTVAWYCAVFRSRVTPFNDYGAVLDSSVDNSADWLGIFQSGGTAFYTGCPVRAVRKNGTALSIPFDLAPVMPWMVMSLSTASSVANVMKLFSMGPIRFAALDIAALAIRYTDPTAGQQTQIEAKLTPMQQALLAA